LLDLVGKHTLFLQNKASLDLVGKQSFTFNGEPHKNLGEKKAQVAQKNC
jgi:hypothetical protein